MNEPIVIQCPLAGHEGEELHFKRDGWKYKHLRIWQEVVLSKNEMSMSELAVFLTERMQGWTMTDGNKNLILFPPEPKLSDENGEPNPEPFELRSKALDEFDPLTASWISSTAFPAAYYQAIMPSPKV